MDNRPLWFGDRFTVTTAVSLTYLLIETGDSCIVTGGTVAGRWSTTRRSSGPNRSLRAGWPGTRLSGPFRVWGERRRRQGRSPNTDAEHPDLTDPVRIIHERLAVPFDGVHHGVPAHPQLVRQLPDGSGVAPDLQAGLHPGAAGPVLRVVLENSSWRGVNHDQRYELHLAVANATPHLPATGLGEYEPA